MRSDRPAFPIHDGPAIASGFPMPAGIQRQAGAPEGGGLVAPFIQANAGSAWGAVPNRSGIGARRQPHAKAAKTRHLRAFRPGRRSRAVPAPHRGGRNLTGRRGTAISPFILGWHLHAVMKPIVATTIAPTAAATATATEPAPKKWSKRPIELMRIPPISAGAGRCGNKILQA